VIVPTFTSMQAGQALRSFSVALNDAKAAEGAEAEWVPDNGGSKAKRTREVRTWRAG